MEAGGKITLLWVFRVGAAPGRLARVRGVNFTIYNLHVNLRKFTVKRTGALHRRRHLYGRTRSRDGVNTDCGQNRFSTPVT